MEKTLTKDNEMAGKKKLTKEDLVCKINEGSVCVYYINAVTENIEENKIVFRAYSDDDNSHEHILAKLWELKIITKKEWESIKADTTLMNNWCYLDEKNELWVMDNEKLTLNQTKRAHALKWIHEGKPCIHRSGFAYKGGRSYPITNEKALDDFPRYSFGMSVCELDWEVQNEQLFLVFEEHSACDMD